MVSMKNAGDAIMQNYGKHLLIYLIVYLLLQLLMTRCGLIVFDNRSFAFMEVFLLT